MLGAVVLSRLVRTKFNLKRTTDPKAIVKIY